MRQSLQILLVLLLVLLAGIAGYMLLFGQGRADRLEVLEAQGQVMRTAEGGAPTPLAVGDQIGAREGVEVADGARAVLGLGEGTRLELESATSVRVLGVDASGVRVELEQGRVRARVRAGGQPLGLSSRGRAIYADDADFSAAVDPDGALQVEAERGRLRLEGVGEGINQLEPGRQVVSMPGGDPVLGAVSSELLLEVGWPEQDSTRMADLLVQGRTGPYASVRVGRGEDWREVRADAQGIFQASVPLDEGGNAVRVQARDALGRTREDEAEIERDSQPPAIGGSEVQWGP